MKVLFIAPVSCIHVARWANSVVDKVDELHILTMHNEAHRFSEQIYIHKLKFKAPLGYILNKFDVQTCVSKIKPDIIHVHQISGHGTLMALINIKGYLISIYGADVYSFPNKSLFHKMLIKYNLKRAGYLASTSNAMARETKKYTNKKIFVTPFGVDIDRFRNSRSPDLESDQIHVGIVKSLREKYGLKYLIKAIPILENRLKDAGNKKEIKVSIYGKGYLRDDLINLASKLNLKNIEFPGFVSNEKVSEILNSFDLVCIPSIEDSESFGVSAVEAMACERPLVVSDVDGLSEVVTQNETGLIVKRKDSEAIAEGLYDLINNPPKALNFGLNGRNRVKELYDWRKNVQEMLAIYDSIK